MAFTCQAGRDSAVDEEGNLVDPSVDGDPEFHPVTVNVTVGDDAAVAPEHVEFRWGTYETAASLLKWDSNRTALWELDYRLSALEL